MKDGYAIASPWTKTILVIVTIASDNVRSYFGQADHGEGDSAECSDRCTPVPTTVIPMASKMEAKST